MHYTLKAYKFSIELKIESATAYAQLIYLIQDSAENILPTLFFQRRLEVRFIMSHDMPSGAWLIIVKYDFSTTRVHIKSLSQT